MNFIGITALVALALSAFGFVMYVYFFSIGYGFSIAGISTALLILFRHELTLGTIILCGLLVLYGIRLGGFLAIRELKSLAYKDLLKVEYEKKVKFGVKISIWISCAILYVCECAPVTFRFVNGSDDDVFLYVGLIMAALGILIELIADLQKSAAKKKNPKMFVSTGLYRIVRCPNYFGELLLWTGVFVSGISVCNSVFQWALVILGFVGIIYVMFSGARRLEIRQDKNYGDNPAYQEYISKTPIILPLIPIKNKKKYKWLVA
mgnify:CR=1 FL=1